MKTTRGSNMRKLMLIMIALLASGPSAVAQGADIRNSVVVESQYRMGYVVVTQKGPLDGGDLGPYTPGTTTSGIQEAIDYALASNPQMNVWITGKQDMQTRAGSYTTYDTIYVPPTQGFRIEGGNYLLNHVGKTGGAIWIDSAMNCSYQFGIVGSQTDSGGVLNIRPENMLPVDTWCYPANVTVSDVRAEAVLGRLIPNVYGLAIDSTWGSIGGNKFFANEIAGTGIGMYLFGNRDIGSNDIKVTRNHGNIINAQIGSEGSDPALIYSNEIRLQMDSDGIKDCKGLVIASGQDNLITLFTCSGFDKGSALVFGPGAGRNIVTSTSITDGFTNLAEIPTNRLITTQPIGFGVETPIVPASESYCINRNPFNVEIIISEPGRVDEWSITDANGGERKIKAPISPGQQFILSPGDKIKLSYIAAPSWQWRAIPF